MKVAVCTGAGGFIGNHLVKVLKTHDYYVRGVDIKYPEFDDTVADEFLQLDLRNFSNCLIALNGADEVYALAADMGGMGHIMTHDAEILSNNLRISVNTVTAAEAVTSGKILFSSSACVYPEYRQKDTEVVPLAESMDYPADPNEGYGWEKMTTERLLMALGDVGRLDPRIARLHAIYGPLGTWCGGREKAPAALCRKVAEAPNGGSIEIWGDGKQTRSFCYIDDCVEGLLRLMRSSYQRPVNVGSEELTTINAMADTIMTIAGKKLSVKHVPGPQGVRGRNSDNSLIKHVLGWSPAITLEAGLTKTYEWINTQVMTEKICA